MHSTVRMYGAACWLDYYDMHMIVCTWYSTLCCIQQDTKLPSTLHCMVPSILWCTLQIALDCTLPAWLSYIYQEALKMFSSILPIALDNLSLLDYMLPRHPPRHSLVHTEYASKCTAKYIFMYTPGQALKDTPNFMLA